MSELFPWMDRLSDSDDDDDTFLAVTHHDPNTRKAANHAARYASAKQLNQETTPLFCPKLRTIAERFQLWLQTTEAVVTMNRL